jgi:hypothetical protein
LESTVYSGGALYFGDTTKCGGPGSDTIFRFLWVIQRLLLAYTFQCVALFLRLHNNLFFVHKLPVGGFNSKNFFFSVAEELVSS